MSYVRIITTDPDRIEPATLPFEHVEIWPSPTSSQLRRALRHPRAGRQFGSGLSPTRTTSRGLCARHLEARSPLVSPRPPCWMKHRSAAPWISQLNSGCPSTSLSNSSTSRALELTWRRRPPLAPTGSATPQNGPLSPSRCWPGAGGWMQISNLGSVEDTERLVAAGVGAGAWARWRHPGNLARLESAGAANGHHGRPDGERGVTDAAPRGSDVRGWVFAWVCRRASCRL